MDCIKVKGQNTNLRDALYLFDFGELTEKETYSMFQDIINKGLVENLPLPFQNAASVFIQCGICKKTL